MYFNCTPHGYCVEEAFRSFTPAYLAMAELITDKCERRQYLFDNLLNQFDDFEQYVRNDICNLVSSLEGFIHNDPAFSKWVHTVAKKHEHSLLKEYMKAINEATDRNAIIAEFLKKIS